MDRIARWQIAILFAGMALGGCASHRARGQRLVTDGGRIFVRAGCGDCHTVASVHATGRLGPDFDTSEQLTRSEILLMLNAGVGGMPSFRQRLTAGEQNAVAAFVLATLRRHH